MSKTILVGGYGPGISKAVAEKFGAEGFSVALVSRTEKRVVEGAKALEAKGIKAAPFVAHLGNAKSVKEMVAKVRAALGPINVVQWTAYAGNLLDADQAAVNEVLDVATTGLLATVQEALVDLKKDKSSAVLVTNGGLGFFDQKADAMAVQWNAMGLALANSAKHKLVRLLSEKLKGEVYVGEVMVLGAVKGTAFDTGHATIDAATVANKFWEMYGARRDLSVTVG
jgi:NAD(P)-dependent dehydrogenase (short-subunit alcohol dehydrogenase family)